MAYVEAVQRRDRPLGPFRTYNLKIDRVLVPPEASAASILKSGLEFVPP